MSEQHYPLVLVTWVDCTTFRGWHTVAESLEFEPDEVETAGFLLADEKKYLRITPSLSGNKDGALTILDAMTIPRSWVMKVEALGLVSSCGCGEEPTIAEKTQCQVVIPGLEEEDCWGAPDDTADSYREQYEAGLITEEQVQELMKPFVPDPEVILGKDVTEIFIPKKRSGCKWCGTEVCVCGDPSLEVKPGDDNLGRQLTLDEWMRRGGKVMEWPPLVGRILRT